MRNTRYDWLIHLGMLVGLIIFYRASYQLPITALGLAIFAPLALLRPDIALLYIPPTIFFHFMPKGIWDERFGIRSDGIRFPLHEIVLLITTGSVLLRLVIDRFVKQKQPLPEAQHRTMETLHATSLQQYFPMILFLIAGTIGVIIALPEARGDALREWRWMIVEPLIFYGLIRWYLSDPLHPRSPIPLLISFVAGGTLVGLIGVLQYWGINLAPLVGDEVGFSQDMMFVEGVLRVNSIYGHPNNLALAMGRVWVPACAMALAAYERRSHLATAAWAIAAFVSISGMYVAFSKGAQLGASGALFVLALCYTIRELRRSQQRSWQRFIPVGIFVAIFATMMISGLRVERLNLMGASSSVRLKTWESALNIIQDHPLVGIGLDQFHRYYAGQGYIHPSLLDTTEQYISHPHNLLLDIWLRLGILGLVAFGWILVRFYRRALHKILPRSHGDTEKREEEGSSSATSYYLAAGLAATMTAALIHGMVDNFYFVVDLAFMFWLVVGVGDTLQKA